MDQPETTWKPHRRGSAPVKGPRANMNNSPANLTATGSASNPDRREDRTLALQTL
jgi:hypothetical protein